MNKWAIANKVLRKMLEIAKGKRFGSTEEYLNSIGKNFDIIDFDKAPIKTFRSTITSEGKYPKRFYNKDGTGNIKKLQELVDEGITYRGVPGVKEDPLRGLVDEITFTKARQAEAGKLVDRFHTFHPEKAYTTDKSSVMYQSTVKDLKTNPNEIAWRTRGHYGHPGEKPEPGYYRDVRSIFEKGQTPRESGKFKEIPGKTGKIEDQIPTFEHMTNNEGLPEKVRVYVPHIKAKRKFTDLGVMTHAQIKWKANQLAEKAKLFYPKNPSVL